MIFFYIFAFLSGISGTPRLSGTRRFSGTCRFSGTPRLSGTPLLRGTPPLAHGFDCIFQKLLR